MANRIQFIYFDLGKVILDFDHDSGIQQLSKLTRLSQTQVQQTLWKDDLQTQYESGTLSTEDFHRAFCSATNTSPDIQDFLFACSNIFTEKPETIQLIRRLSANSVPLGILSNTCPAHWEFVISEFSWLTTAFSSMILSYHVRAMKPSPLIYQAAIDSAGVSAEQIFFVDDIPRNVAGARQLGMDAMPFISADQLESELVQRQLLV